MSYFNLNEFLEVLQQINNEKAKSSEDIRKTINNMQQVLKIEKNVETYLANFGIENLSGDEWKYANYLFYLVLRIIENVNLDSDLKDELISVKNQNILFNVIQEASNFSSKVCLNKIKDSTRVPEAVTYNTVTMTPQQYEKLVSSVEILSKFFDVKLICASGLLYDAKLDYIIALITIITANKDTNHVKRCRQLLANCNKNFSNEFLFKFSIITKGFLGLSKEFQMFTHRALLKQIKTDSGFQMLCETLLSQSNSQNPVWKINETISKIVLGVMLDESTALAMIDNIFKALKISKMNGDANVVGASVCCLKNIYEKGYQSKIDGVIREKLEVLVNPDVILQGAVLMEHNEIRYLIDFLYCLFSGSTIASLPSKIIVPYLNVLFRFYLLLPDCFEKPNLVETIVFCLSNRNPDEISEIVAKILLKTDNSKFLDLHQKIVLKENDSICSIQIGTSEATYLDDSETFLQILQNSNNNLLVYNVFLSCLRLFLENFLNEELNSNLIEGSVDKDDLGEILSNKFFKKLTILELITNLVSLKSIHSQFNENPQEVLSLIHKILEKSQESDEKILIMLFSIYREFIYKLKNVDQQKEYLVEVEKLKKKYKSQELINQINQIFDLKTDAKVNSGIEYKDAINLLNENETHCKVYGINLLIKLLEKKDPQTVANKHSVLAIGLKNLRDSESYSFLNVIRLLVVLTNFLESEVIDALVQEYKNKELDIDERLKIGEVIIKVTEMLGAISYKYKDVLINCFLIGCRDKDDEFRTSSLANLGTICKILSYQIHNFFQELHLLLESIITTDTYLPSKRAAVMVLSQTLAGLENLMDFEAYLTPIFRLLKHVLAQESDPQTRIHAEIGLDHLNKKAKEFLKPEQKMEKEIKIILDEKSNPKTKEIVYK